jgi:hypothetical protein
MSLKNAKQLMEGVAKTLGCDGDVLGDNGMCTITLEKDWMPPIHICYIDSDNSMLFFAEIGILTSENETRILKELMHRHYLFAETNGACASLSGDNNMITVQLKFSLSELTEIDLISLLNNFAGEAAKVKILVYGKENAENAESTDTVIPLTAEDTLLEI